MSLWTALTRYITQTRQELALHRSSSSKIAARGHDLSRVSALQTLDQSIKARKLYVFGREMMPLDKVGGVPIEEVETPLLRTTFHSGCMAGVGPLKGCV